MSEKLTVQQEQAIVNRGGKLLVSAAAGSGKTKVLVDRLLRYLEDPVDPANIDEFLIITYTKAAAAELRGKIASKLTEKIALHPENRHLQMQLQRLYLAKISTVHAFCADLLREYAYRLDIPADFRVADEDECLAIQQQTLDRILEETYRAEADQSFFYAFVDSQGLGRDDRFIPEIVLKVYNSSRCHLDPQEWLEHCYSSNDTDALSDAAETSWGAFLISDLHTYLDLQIDSLRNCMDKAIQVSGMEKPAALLNQTVFQLERLRMANTWDEVLARKDIDFGRLVFSKKCADPDLAEKIKAVRNQCKKGLEKKLRSFSDSSEQVLQDLHTSSFAAKGLIALVRTFSAEYDRQKNGRRILDFGDLEHKTLDLLLGKKRSGRTILASEIGSRFREVMVDEYQDTNAVQDSIFSALTFERQNCFMVGDVKQSIYQFRLADPGIFIEKYNTYTDVDQQKPGVGRKILLNKNFRSSAGVIEAVNDVFSACMSEAVGGLKYGSDEQLFEGIPHISLPEPEVELQCIDVREDTYAEEAAVVARRIKQLLDGHHYVRDQGKLRSIVPDDIVILLRSPGSVGAEFSFALEEHGIRCCSESNQDLFQTEEVRSLCAILQIINNPVQDIPLVAALTSRVFGFSADDLVQIRSAKRYASIYDALKNCQMEKASEFLKVLDTLRNSSKLCTISQLIQKIYHLTKFDSIYACLENGQERKENLNAFFQFAVNGEMTGRHSLNQFLMHINSLEKKGFMVSKSQNTSGAVTIMSIHKSKGLEFPVVFLCGLSRGFNQESARDNVLCDRELGIGLSCVDAGLRIRYPTISKRAIALKTISDSISEELRVLYVAMTRAKDRLIMTYAAKNLDKEIGDIVSRMDLSNPRLMTGYVSCPGEWVLQTALRRTEAGELFVFGGYPDQICSKEQVWKISVIQSPADPVASVPENLPAESISQTQLDELKTALAFRYEQAAATRFPSKQTATQIKGRPKDMEAAQNAEETRPYYRKFRKPGFAETTPDGMTRGSAMHILMQYIDFDKCSEYCSVESEIQRLVDARLLKQSEADLIEIDQIQKFFDSDLGKRLQSSGEILREFKFSILMEAERFSKDLQGEQILLQGVIDCAILDPDGIVIIDFKTDNVNQNTVESVASNYYEQVNVYAEAMRRIYQLPIKEKILYFFKLNKTISVP